MEKAKERKGREGEGKGGEGTRESRVIHVSAFLIATSIIAISSPYFFTCQLSLYRHLHLLILPVSLSRSFFIVLYRWSSVTALCYRYIHCCYCHFTFFLPVIHCLLSRASIFLLVFCYFFLYLVPTIITYTTVIFPLWLTLCILCCLPS